MEVKWNTSTLWPHLMIQRYSPVGKFHGILNWNLRFSELRADSDSSYLGRETELKSDFWKKIALNIVIKSRLKRQTAWVQMHWVFCCCCCWTVRLGKSRAASLTITFMKMLEVMLNSPGRGTLQVFSKSLIPLLWRGGFNLLFLNHWDSGTGSECTLRSTSWPRLEPPGKHYSFSLERPFFMFLINLLY